MTAMKNACISRGVDEDAANTSVSAHRRRAALVPRAAAHQKAVVTGGV
jgi:hypothetical protein